MKPVFLHAARVLSSVSATPIAPTRLRQLERLHPEARRRSMTAELLLCHAVRTLRPSEVPIPPVRCTAPWGKPYLAENPAFQFSLSHSGEWAVLAISDAPVGVDIERCSAPKPAVVRRFFHPQEQSAFFSLPEDEQLPAFYDWWVLKESAVKAIGCGMHRPFSSFSVSLGPSPQLHGFTEPARLACIPFCDKAYRLGLCVLTEEPICPSLQVLSPAELLSPN